MGEHPSVLRIAAAVVGVWFALGLVVALAVGRAGRRSGLESITGATSAVATSGVAPRVDELGVRRARRATIGVRVAAVAAAIGVVAAIGSLPNVTSFGHRPASNVKAPVVLEEHADVAPASPLTPRGAAAERFDAAERPALPALTSGADAPGHDPAGPGRSEDAPGHDPAGPGRSEDAPGQDPADPGRSEDAPGPRDLDDTHDRSADSLARAGEAPGRSDEAPWPDRGRAKDARSKP